MELLQLKYSSKLLLIFNDMELSTQTETYCRMVRLGVTVKSNVMSSTDKKSFY